MADLDTQIAQAQARMKDLQAKARRMKRRDDTRRKILYGAAALSLVQELDAVSREKFLRRLHRQVRREKDRQFLGISENANASSVVRAPGQSARSSAYPDKV